MSFVFNKVYAHKSNCNSLNKAISTNYFPSIFFIFEAGRVEIMEIKKINSQAEIKIGPPEKLTLTVVGLQQLSETGKTDSREKISA